MINKVCRRKNGNYTTISNVFLRDKNISLKAKGLLAVVLGLPDDWDFSIKGLGGILIEGNTAIYSAIDELKTYGYCTFATIRDDKGKIVGNSYDFCESPYMENPNVENQAQLKKEEIKDLSNKKEIDKSISKKSKELFEECWVAYRRKGSKKKALEYWNKLTDVEKEHLVLPHIKAYVSTRDLSYQKDFERYLRDKTFATIIVQGNNVVYDPTRIENGQDETYLPETSISLRWSDDFKSYVYIGYWNGFIPDGYTDDNRPDGARVMLSNGRGTIVWNKQKNRWEGE